LKGLSKAGRSTASQYKAQSQKPFVLSTNFSS
jgi:hypothetical protein